MPHIDLISLFIAPVWGLYIGVNYPFAKDKWASCFTATCLLLRRVRSLTVAPHVYSQVPYEVLMSYTDNANVLIVFETIKLFYIFLSLISHPRKNYGRVLRSII